jgi:guanylate kinase
MDRLTGVTGTVYLLLSHLSYTFWQLKCFAFYTLATHSMEKIVQAFDPETGQIHRNVQKVIDWPISDGVWGGEEYKNFFEWAEGLNNYHPDIKKDESFRNLHNSQIRYQTEIYDERLNSLRVFSQEEQEFLKCYVGLRKCPKPFKSKELFSVTEDNQAQEKAENLLQSFEIKDGTIRCPDASGLQVIIPYVKRLLQLFPDIKEIEKRFWQCETNSCIEQMKQSPLDVNPDAMNVGEFLEDEEHQVLMLQVVGGDEWTGLIKVYQVLQKTKRLVEGRYTVLSLERLLSLNMVEGFRKLMESIERPYIMLVACEANQLLKEETKYMISTFFETMKQKSCIKIILTIKSKDGEVDFLKQKDMEIFGNGFVTKAEQLNWSDLTSSSQVKLLEKSVKFQGAKISLNEIMTDESPAANSLPLGALLKEEELEIADPVPISGGYNEDYYIGRTLRCQISVKEDIYSDKNVNESHVHLASNEQEFQKLCEQNPKSSVLWLEKGKSGKLVLRQSQGSLETVCTYIDTESSHTYTADDLDKLLEQAQRQRVMVISDAAGMGKSTLLTHLSREIKRNFPTKWVVRIDLNDHTDSLKALKQEKIDEEKAIKFISEKVLKLKPGLELELFKQCCEKNQNVRIVIMLDGVDEISPFYKETVINLLQALKQTAVEQLWVTTRPHLKEDLEDKLEQLSYTLEAFSERNQFDFLTKFWSLRDWFTETHETEKEMEGKKLEIYAEHLIEKLAASIRDKDKEFTGIPLQTRLLAEAFDEEVQKFYRSAESTPELLFSLDLPDLYRKFIERKYDIYQTEKFQVPATSAYAIEQRKRELKHMREDHQLLALKVLFTDKQTALLQNKKECTFSAEQLTNIGIVQISDDGKPHFIHRTFAEYFAADCLVDRLTEVKNISHKVQTLILKHILRRAEFRMISFCRYFFVQV